jgi:transposase InsO family protein
VPTIFHSDNGKEFVNSLSTELMTKLHIDVRHGKPHKPTTQGSVERFNQTLEKIIGKDGWSDDGSASGHVNTRWVDRLQCLVFCYNARISRTHRRSPFEVMFGRTPFLKCSQGARDDTADDEEDDGNGT